MALVLLDPTVHPQLGEESICYVLDAVRGQIGQCLDLSLPFVCCWKTHVHVHFYGGNMPRERNHTGMTFTPPEIYQAYTATLLALPNLD